MAKKKAAGQKQAKDLAIRKSKPLEAVKGGRPKVDPKYGRSDVLKSEA